MRWESVHVNARARETPDGRKTSGRTGGIWGPGVRWGHTCNAVKGGRYIYVFGGYGADNCQTNEVHVFDSVKQTWCKPMMKGLPPSPRDSHSCTTVGNRLFVFGGTDGKTPLKDLHILETSSNTWIVPTLHGDGPDAREGHSAALVGKRLFIFGGCGKSSENQEIYYNDLYILDTEKLIWERAVTSGVPPSARDSHTSSSWKNKIIVLGGEDSSDCYLSDVHMLDADTLVWTQVSTSGQMLAPRAGHTTVALGSNLFVFGGFTDDRNLYDDLHVLNVDSGLWSRVATVDQGPSARFSVAGNCLDERKGILVFIGGCNKDLEALDDMYYLHTDIHVGNGQLEQKRKLSMKKELKRKCQENYLPARGSEKDIDVPEIDMVSNPSQTAIIQEGNQSGTKISYPRSSGGVKFNARLLNPSQNRYTIETTINGHLFHGLLLYCNTRPVQDNHAYPNKKSLGADVEGDALNQYQPNLKTGTAIHQEAKCSDQGQNDGAPNKDSLYQESHNVFGSNLISSTPDAGLYQPNMIAGSSDPSLTPLGELNGETPNSNHKSNMGKPSEPPSASAEGTQVTTPSQGVNADAQTINALENSGKMGEQMNQLGGF